MVDLALSRDPILTTDQADGKSLKPPGTAPQQGAQPAPPVTVIAYVLLTAGALLHAALLPSAFLQIHGSEASDTTKVVASVFVSGVGVVVVGGTLLLAYGAATGKRWATVASSLAAIALALATLLGGSAWEAIVAAVVTIAAAGLLWTPRARRYVSDRRESARLARRSRYVS